MDQTVPFALLIKGPYHQRSHRRAVLVGKCLGVFRGRA
jgi:hypothetical protein